MSQPQKTAQRSRFATLSLRPLLAGVLLGGLAALWCAPARACKCAQLTPADANEQADAVFEGHVVAVHIDASASDSAPRLRVRFSAVRAWKGIGGEVVEVVTPSESAACGYAFEPDQSYFVYATEQDGILVVSSCNRTRKMSEADEDVRVLGMGATPVDVRTPPRARARVSVQPAPRAGCASCSAHGANAGAARALVPVFALLALLRVTFRRRSGSRS